MIFPGGIVDYVMLVKRTSGTTPVAYKFTALMMGMDTRVFCLVIHKKA